MLHIGSPSAWSQLCMVALPLFLNVCAVALSLADLASSLLQLYKFIVHTCCACGLWALAVYLRASYYLICVPCTAILLYSYALR